MNPEILDCVKTLGSSLEPATTCRPASTTAIVGLRSNTVSKEALAFEQDDATAISRWLGDGGAEGDSLGEMS